MLLLNGGRYHVEIAADSTQSTTRYYSIAGQRPAMRNSDGSINYLLGDHLGSVSTVVDASGEIISQSRYLPFGEVLWEDGASPTDYTYTGQRSLSDIGLMDYNARFYDPMLGRFTSPDSIVPEPGSVIGYNRFAYVDNNPMIYTDPSGHIPLDIIIDGLFIAFDLVVITTDFVDIGRDGFTDENRTLLAQDTGWLALDILCAIFPYGTGGSAIGKTATHGWNVAEVLARAETIVIRIPQTVREIELAGKGIQIATHAFMDSGTNQSDENSSGTNPVGTEGKRSGGVYTLRTERGTVIRNGRTNDLGRRKLQHKLNFPDLKFYTEFETNMYNEQRGLEEVIENLYNPIMNKRNAIGPQNPNIEIYRNAAQNYLNRDWRLNVPK